MHSSDGKKPTTNCHMTLTSLFMELGVDGWEEGPTWFKCVRWAFMCGSDQHGQTEPSTVWNDIVCVREEVCRLRTQK